MQATQRQAAAVRAPPRSGRRVVFKNEGIGRKRLQNVEIVSNITFGVELETFFPSDVTVEVLQNTLTGNVGRGWRIKNDNSIVCNPRLPSCYRAELVSPILRGTEGVRGVYDVLKSIKQHSPSVNKSTGMHVHVGEEGDWQLSQLKVLSHNFVQLESAFDQLMPYSRRENANRYCRSNLAAVTLNRTRSKQDALAAIAAADSIPALQQLMCTDRYMKLNLMALDRHGTVEFRHAGGSQNAAKATGYILLWVLLVEASLKNKKALMPKKGYSFENLLRFYAHSPVLTHWLPRRHLELNSKGTQSSTATNSTSRQASGHTSGCGCNDCRNNRR